MSNSPLTHVDASGNANMVDVGDKAITTRIARATVTVKMQAATLTAIRENTLKKGDVLAVARVAGIQAAKRCSDLIPLCHPLMLSKVDVQFRFDDHEPVLHIDTLCKLNGQTGVEMEALTAASVAALTVYDMCKAIDMGIVIDGLCLIEKDGGRRGHYQRGDA